MTAAASWGDPVLPCCPTSLGIDCLVSSTDYPHLRRDLGVSSRKHIEADPELTDSKRLDLGQ